MYDFERRRLIVDAIMAALVQRDEAGKSGKGIHCMICDVERINVPTLIQLEHQSSFEITAKIMEVTPEESDGTWSTLIPSDGDATIEFLVCPRCAVDKGIQKEKPSPTAAPDLDEHSESPSSGQL